MRTLMIALALLGTACSGTHEPCADSGPAAAPDGGDPVTVSARWGCGLLGRLHTQQVESGVFAECPDRPACPFPYDPIDPSSGRCDPLVVEWCVSELESRANDCERYADVLAECEAMEGCR